MDKTNDILICEKWLSETVADHYFDVLTNTVKWTNELRTTSGAIKKINREMAYYSDEECIYKYANFELPGQVWLESLKPLRQVLEYDTSLLFNSVLLNKYRDGKDEIKWHSDNEPQLGPNPVIACVNLGATRKFHFLNKSTGEKSFHYLSHGDLLIMKEHCQENYLHAILPEKEVKTPRISLTFRRVYDTMPKP